MHMHSVSAYADDTNNEVSQLVQSCWDAELIYVAITPNGKFASVWPCEENDSKIVARFGFQLASRNERKDLPWREVWRNMSESD